MQEQLVTNNTHVNQMICINTKRFLELLYTTDTTIEDLKKFLLDNEFRDKSILTWEIIEFSFKKDKSDQYVHNNIIKSGDLLLYFSKQDQGFGCFCYSFSACKLQTWKNFNKEEKNKFIECILRAIELGQNILNFNNQDYGISLLLVDMYFREKNYIQAIKTAKKFNLPLTIEQRESTLFTSLCEMYLKLYEDKTIDILAKNITQKLNISNSLIKPKRLALTLPGWYPISTNLDGFDLRASDSFNEHYLKIKSEFKFSKEAISLLDQQLMLINSGKLSNSTKVLLDLHSINDNYKEKKKLLSDNYNERRESEIDDYYEKYINTSIVEIKRQYQSETHFFNPRRAKNFQALTFAMDLLIARVNKGQQVPMPMDAIPARRLITAERSIVENVIQTFDLYKKGNYRGYVESGIGWNENSDFTKNFLSYSIRYSHDETIKIGESTITYHHRLNPHVNHLGDFYTSSLSSYLNGVSNYNAICQKLCEITENNPNKEILLAKTMLDFCSKGIPLTLSKLIEIKKDATSHDLHALNQIFYHCFIKEVASWMLPSDDSHKLPLAVAQARALKLLNEGYLTIKDIFEQDCPYGVYTGTNIGADPDKIRDKIIKINLLYNKALLEHDPSNFQHNIRFFKQHPDGSIISTREEMHKELKEIYGGTDSDSDGEGYVSDDEMQQTHDFIMNYPIKN